MANKRATLSDLLNDLTFKIHFERLKNLSLNMFTWTGLPETMRQEYIESALFTYGRAIFCEDPELGLLCLPCSPDGGVNVYNQHTKWRAQGYGGYNKRFDVDDCVIIRNTPIFSPTYDIVMMYANKLTEIDRSIDVNVKAQKTPYIIKCDDKDLLTMKNIFAQIDGNKPVIFPDKNLSLDSIDVLSTQAPYVADKLCDLRHDTTNEILTMLGINSANTDKRERLISDEVNSNNELIELSVAHMLDARLKACEEINSRFNLNISVELRRCDCEQVHTDTQTDS